MQEKKAIKEELVNSKNPRHGKSRKLISEELKITHSHSIKLVFFGKFKVFVFDLSQQKSAPNVSPQNSTSRKQMNESTWCQMDAIFHDKK